ncbi:MAG: thiamine phosphate synthase [Oliverpabstia sp.]|nr:thiamine phosphate synthase [Oliverpabstia sp.]
MKIKPEMLRVYGVTDASWTGRFTLLEQVEQALKGGVTCIQFRDKQLENDAFLQEAKKMKLLCEKYHVPLIINDHVDIAVRCGADGVHVGQKDMEAKEVRKLVGEKMIIGVSARTVEQAIQAEQAGADYLGVGAVFGTSTKMDAEKISLERLKDICQAVKIPVVAIGGIQKDNFPELAGTGVAGAALVSAIFSAQDIEEECRKLRNISEQIVCKS